jgi:hypothetical protein
MIYMKLFYRTFFGRRGKEQEFERADDQKLTYDRYVAEGRKWIKKRSGDMRYRLDIDSPQSLDGNFFPFGPLTD